MNRVIVLWDTGQKSEELTISSDSDNTYKVAIVYGKIEKVYLYDSLSSSWIDISESATDMHEANRIIAPIYGSDCTIWIRP